MRFAIYVDHKIHNILLLTRRCHSNISKPLFTYISEKSRNNVAISDELHSTTYGELDCNSNIVAKALQNNVGTFSGPDRQHAISFLCGNNFTYVNTLLGIWKSGNIAVPLSQTHPSSLLEYYVKDSESSAIITTKYYVDKVHTFVDTDNVKVLLLEEMLYDDSTNNSTVSIEALSEHTTLTKDALILYTSGTTGSPKGVLQTHNNIISMVNTMLGPWRWSEKDCILHILPLHHTHGLINCLLCPLAIGAKVVMLPKFDVASVWKMLLFAGKDNFNVNVFMAVPSVYTKLIEYYQINESSFAGIDVKATLTENIRLMVSGSAALPIKVLNEWHSISGHMLLERYGMTEIGMALGNSYDHTSRLPGFVGNPLPGVKVRIVESGTDKVLVSGSQNGTIVNDKIRPTLLGDLHVRGPTVFKNYYKKLEATKKEFTPDGWFKTGDIAEFVASKNAYKIVGRSSVDIIKSGGYKIGALEVERILLEHESIKDVAVVGVDDVMWGQRVGAVVVLKRSDTSNDSFELAGLKEWAKEKMSSYMIPTLLKVMEELPRNAMGKVNKKELVKVAFPA